MTNPTKYGIIEWCPEMDKFLEGKGGGDFLERRNIMKDDPDVNDDNLCALGHIPETITVFYNSYLSVITRCRKCKKEIKRRNFYQSFLYQEAKSDLDIFIEA